ncbi:adult-specific rigid cuticular protein 15.7-like [Dermacentor silvarum]|uniref:adult-specific rigid cuticular protein 15.7-like n=1 Tax=Dermacentor silvarum TaxID=543639 RepID=UPI00189845D5|nr:adult-specific rigid cuticular protein 15.7-like [Dermacentor silvarum]
MIKTAVIALCLAQWASCQFPQFPQRFLPQTLPKPVLVPVVTGGGGPVPVGWSPYSFAYDAVGLDGSSTRSESGDAQGRVTGFYTITTAEGSRRRVSYVADENGFRATVDTNEHGTADEAPADVVWRSTAPKVHGGGLTRPAGASGAQAAFYPAGAGQVQQQQQPFRYPFSKA